ncbi:MAG TPA: enoyl-CoA hydratase-related protein, partial [Acidobacteriaceae bacterium]|nr:enoyl-CoA hydratase-related protein [Acidobacteriaceae bacterium]
MGGELMAMEASGFETLRIERRGAVVTVALARPKALNALNAAMLRELESVFGELRADTAVRVVLLTGEGERAFAAGADIRELVELDEVGGRAFSEAGQRVSSGMERLGKPVIGCLNGLALGGGLELALACTFRIAAEGSQLGLPEAKLGLVPGFGGAYRLMRLVGRSAALRMMLTAGSVGAAEALRMGL